MSQVPPVLGETHDVLVRADAYVTITPEYNHAPSPALVNILNHFGSSTFAFKPSAIVSYSAGQWGGTRAAIGFRPILSELGCLPVSAMVHVPNAADVFDEDGEVMGGDDEVKRWEGYVDRCLSQLEWWGEGCEAAQERGRPFPRESGVRLLAEAAECSILMRSVGWIFAIGSWAPWVNLQRINRAVVFVLMKWGKRGYSDTLCCTQKSW